MIIVPGPASRKLSLKIAEVLRIKATPIEFKLFPDGESYICYTEDVSGENVVIVQNTCPPQDVNLIRLLLLINTAKDLNAKSITAVVPYFAYARQMKRSRPGEAISVRTIIGLIEKAGADRFITVNIHNTSILNWFNIPVQNLSAIPLLASFFKARGLTGAFSFAPDDGALEANKEADKILGGGYGYLDKERDAITGEIRVKKKMFDVKDRDCVVFDDIISTGATMEVAVKTLKKQGARRVYAACVHPILVADARKRILSSGAEEIIGTDSVPSPVSAVSIVPIIAEALKRKA